MNMRIRTVVAAAAFVLIAQEASAANRVLFRGSEGAAIASATGQAAGYVGLPGAGENPAGSCPTCVPGGTADANFGAGVPNQIVTFLHPYTNRAITIPLTLPVGRPHIVTRGNRIVYDYGLFRQKVIVIFKPDGLVEVVYRAW
jgi:hypothetical protein